MAQSIQTTSMQVKPAWPAVSHITSDGRLELSWRVMDESFTKANVILL